MIYDWPGNVRQLRNLIEKLLFSVLRNNEKKEITIEMFYNEIRDIIKETDYGNYDFMSQFYDQDYKKARYLFEKAYLEQQLVKFDGSIVKTANFIGMNRAALHRKLRELGVKRGG